MINKVILIGNVGADPEIRVLESGIKVATVRVATTERIYNRESQEAREHTEWHSVTLWRNLADVADRFVRKGSQIYIEGRLRSRDWTDTQGVKRYAIDIVADDLKLLGRKQDGVSTQPISQQQAAAPQAAGQAGAYQAPQPAAAPQYGTPQQAPAQQYGAAPQPAAAPAPQYGTPAQAPVQQAPGVDIVMPEDPDDLPF